MNKLFQHRKFEPWPLQLKLYRRHLFRMYWESGRCCLSLWGTARTEKLSRSEVGHLAATAWSSTISFQSPSLDRNNRRLVTSLKFKQNSTVYNNIRHDDTWHVIQWRHPVVHYIIYLFILFIYLFINQTLLSATYTMTSGQLYIVYNCTVQI